ncbi:hypothetical protein ABTE52_22660, partial [Acinetobacter baumannii]
NAFDVPPLCLRRESPKKAGAIFRDKKIECCRHTDVPSARTGLFSAIRVFTDSRFLLLRIGAGRGTFFLVTSFVVKQKK